MPIPQRLTRVKPGFNSGFARLFGKGKVHVIMHCNQYITHFNHTLAITHFVWYITRTHSHIGIILRLSIQLPFSLIHIVKNLTILVCYMLNILYFTLSLSNNAKLTSSTCVLIYRVDTTFYIQIKNVRCVHLYVKTRCNTLVASMQQSETPSFIHR